MREGGSRSPDSRSSSTRHELWAYPQPGSDHFMAKATIPDEGDVVIECPRGIPYRLRLVDETGAAVEAEVAYYSVFPNPIVYTMFPSNSVQGMYPLSRAKRQDDGTYIGAVIPGPGVVVAKTRARRPTGRRTLTPRHSSPRERPTGNRRTKTHFMAIIPWTALPIWVDRAA